jgi:hypothetical protein
MAAYPVWLSGCKTGSFLPAVDVFADGLASKIHRKDQSLRMALPERKKWSCDLFDDFPSS